MHNYEVRFDEHSSCWELCAVDTVPAQRIAAYGTPEEAITGSAEICVGAAANSGTINLTVRSIDGSALCERTFTATPAAPMLCARTVSKPDADIAAG